MKNLSYNVLFLYGYLIESGDLPQQLNYVIYFQILTIISQGRKDGFCWVFTRFVDSKVESTYKINLPMLNSFHIRANKQKNNFF